MWINKMSANVYWKQVKPVSGHDLGLAAPSRFMSNMREAFGSETPTLDKSCIFLLKGLSIGDGGDMGGNPYEKLIEAIKKYGEIELWAEY